MNIGLISKAAPELKSVVVSPEDAVVTFSKYVQVDSVNEQVLSVKGLSGKVEATNAEAGIDGTMLASKFRFIFNSAATEATAVCVIRPENITVELPEYVSVGAESKLSVLVSATGGFSDMELECLVDEEFLEIVSVGKLSEDGTAEVVIKAKKAGVSLLKVCVAGTDVVSEQDVIAAGAQDAGLMKFVEREKNKTVEPVVTETARPSILLWIVIAVVVLGIVAGTTAVVIKKRRKTA